MLDVIPQFSGKMDPGGLDLGIGYYLRDEMRFEHVIRAVSAKFGYLEAHQGFQVWKWPQLCWLLRSMLNVEKNGDLHRGYALPVRWTYGCCELP